VAQAIAEQRMIVCEKDFYSIRFRHPGSPVILQLREKAGPAPPVTPKGDEKIKKFNARLKT
jgi:hypothetical protein